MRWLPNALTLVRIILTPFIGLELAARDFGGAFPLIILAGITDALDGLLARRFHWHTALGAKLDPIADKLLLSVVFLALGFAGALPWWIVVLVLGRDLLILAFAAWALRFTSIRAFPPSLWGKISTILQISLAAAAVLNGARPGLLWDWIEPLALYLAAAGTAWSGVHYAFLGRQLLQKPQTGSPLAD
jgi:cardiolipin synthase (CMP-forming)